MKNIITQLNPAFDHRNRLGIMSILVVNDWVEYNTLKELLNLTDGNLASHLKALESAAYITIQKRFVGRKPQTSYAATDAGKAAFKTHLDTLEAILRMAREGEDD
ncbi:MAG: transcriptional regulator [Bacteroidetes bacterium]|nr:MAG: transcriptional regulator [Bacteroidota bacterium]